LHFDHFEPSYNGVQNALDLLPLLWTHFDKGDQVLRLLNLVCQRSSSKETLIGLLEVQETLATQLSKWDEDDEENIAGACFCALLDLYSKGLLGI
jgi:hypothetical protein